MRQTYCCIALFCEKDRKNATQGATSCGTTLEGGRDHPPIEIIAFPGHDTFRHKKLWQAKVLIEGGVTSEMKSVVVPDSLMKSMLGEEAAERLLKALGLSTERPTVVHPMPLHVSAPLRDAMSSQFSGAARKLHAQARILDYLAGLLNFVLSEKLQRGKHRHQPPQE